MPFEAAARPPRKIAVIGAGISGLGAALALSRDDHVTLIEAEGRLGGHARTKMAGRNGDQPVDTGFIVFNYANYPRLTALFAELGVPVCESNMSFGASIGGGAVEYGLASAGAVFAQRRNLARPAFLRMIRDVVRFNARALDTARSDEAMTIGGLIDRLRMGPWFRDYYLLPLSGAIWSTPCEQILDFPAKAMMEFFENHALLHHTGQHQWYTVRGGSRQYVSRVGAALRERGAQIRLNAPVAGVRRDEMGAEVRIEGGEWERFDEVILATHSDDTLRLLSDADADERRILSAVRYQPNRIVLHSDASVMPRRRKVWSSWVYTEVANRAPGPIDLTYWMNSLQPWLKDEDIFVTLNSDRQIREDLTWDEVTFRHPVYDLPALAAQKEAGARNGRRHTWLCGAWMKNGFHEDGLASAEAVVEGLRAPDPLAVAAE